jgi:hypothetical protein
MKAILIVSVIAVTVCVFAGLYIAGIYAVYSSKKFMDAEHI